MFSDLYIDIFTLGPPKGAPRRPQGDTKEPARPQGCPKETPRRHQGSHQGPPRGPPEDPRVQLLSKNHPKSYFMLTVHTKSSFVFYQTCFSNIHITVQTDIPRQINIFKNKHSFDKQSTPNRHNSDSRQTVHTEPLEISVYTDSSHQITSNSLNQQTLHTKSLFSRGAPRVSQGDPKETPRSHQGPQGIPRGPPEDPRAQLLSKNVSQRAPKLTH